MANSFISDVRSFVATRFSTDLIKNSKESERYSTVDIALSLIREKTRDVLKALNYSIVWAGKVVPDLHPNVKSFGLCLGETKNLLGAVEVPEKAYRFLQTLSNVPFNLDRGVSIGIVARVVLKSAASLTTSVCEGIEFSTKYIKYDEGTLRWVKGISFVATLTGSSIGSYEELADLMKVEGVKNKTFHMINLARDASYAVLGALGLRSTITKTPLEPWMILACLTSGLTFSIGGYFYERIFDPEKEGKNLNPGTVFRNVVRSRQL